MIKTRTVVSGVIALAHIAIMPLTENGIQVEVIRMFEWWVVVACIIVFSGVFSLMIITAQEAKLIFSHFANIFAGVLIVCWFILILTNNMTNLERGLPHSFGVCLIYLASVLILGFLLGALVDRIIKKSRL